MDDVSFYVFYSFIYLRLNKPDNNFSDMLGAMLKKKYILCLFQRERERGGGKRKLGEQKETRGEKEEEGKGKNSLAVKSNRKERISITKLKNEQHY